MLASRGIVLSVIPGQREAALSFLGASNDFAGQRIMVVDIGGGSTEVVVGQAGSEPDRSRSFNVGCRRVTEKFLHSDPPSPEEIDQARMWIREQMASFFNEGLHDGACHDDARHDDVCHDGVCHDDARHGEGRNGDDAGRCDNRCLDCLVAVAGTATSVVSIRDRMQTYDSARVHKARVSRIQLDEIARSLAEAPLAQRRETVGLDPDRAPVIVAGMLILQEVMSFAGVDSFVASEADILQGIILDSSRS